MWNVARVTVIANLVLAAVALLVLALLPSRPEHERDGRSRMPRTAGAAPRSTSGPLPTHAPSPAPPVTATVESARKVGANELGMVPVIMYHRLLSRRVASIDRTPSQLRHELERLARESYVPITAAELVSRNIDIPAGTHPVVLTFDDGHPSHFSLDAHGMPRDNTAVGIIYKVAAEYPSFRPVATFWVNRNPFGLRDRDQQVRAVRWLLDHGFEVANHTYAHPDLRRLTTRRVEEQIVRQERLLAKLGVASSTTFALPYGSPPRKLGVAHDGKWDGTAYHFAGVFLAGAEPAISPYAKKFSRYAIPRIQSNGKHGDCRRWCTAYWLDRLDKHPMERYTSDGDPMRVSVPRKLVGKIISTKAAAVLAY